MSQYVKCISELKVPYLDVDGSVLCDKLIPYSTILRIVLPQTLVDNDKIKLLDESTGHYFVIPKIIADISFVRLVRKYDFVTHNYILEERPLSWNISNFERSLSTKVNCANCGKTLEYGHGCTSLQYTLHEAAFGYIVCGVCHVVEMHNKLHEWDT